MSPYFYLEEPDNNQQVTGSVPVEMRVIFQKYMQMLNSMDITSQIL